MDRKFPGVSLYIHILFVPQFGTGGADSHWEVNNVFQSGGESPTQPAKPPAIKKAPSRRAGQAYRTVKSPSAEPEDDFEEEAPVASTSGYRQPVNSRYRAYVPDSSSPISSPAQRQQAPAPAPRRSINPPQPVQPAQPEEESEEEVDELEEGSVEDEDEVFIAPEYEGSPAPRADEDHNTIVSRKLGELAPDSRALVRKSTPSSGILAKSTRAMSYLFVLLAMLATGMYKIGSTSIGYCDAGSSSNAVLRELRENRLAAKECTARLLASEESRVVDDVLCPLEAFIPIPPPDSCTPCPNRAMCQPHDVICKGAFILQEHPLAGVPGLSWLANGMPGLGSVAFPPTCVEDRRRLMMVGALGKSLEVWLSKVKGDKLCKGLAKRKDGAGDAQAWGVTKQQLKDTIKRSVKVGLKSCTTCCALTDTPVLILLETDS